VFSAVKGFESSGIHLLLISNSLRLRLYEFIHKIIVDSITMHGKHEKLAGDFFSLGTQDLFYKQECLLQILNFQQFQRRCSDIAC
jgi:hypothetical protein